MKVSKIFCEIEISKRSFVFVPVRGVVGSVRYAVVLVRDVREKVLALLKATDILQIYMRDLTRGGFAGRIIEMLISSIEEMSFLRFRTV